MKQKPHIAWRTMWSETEGRGKEEERRDGHKKGISDANRGERGIMSYLSCNVPNNAFYKLLLNQI